MNIMNKRVLMTELARTEILAGALFGRKVLAKLLELTDTEPASPQLVFLDFAGVNVATASFLRETVLAYRDTIRRRRSNFYPVIANTSPLIEEELKILVTSEGDVLTLCTLDKNNKPREPRLLGTLEPKQRLTLDLVQRHKETDAAELMREHGEKEGVKHTAWNNRLSALAGMGLVIELNEGRAKRYRPLLGEATHGN
jgi:hypothetical protein